MCVAFKRLNGFCIIILSLIILSCASSEEKKMEFFEKGKALYEILRGLLHARNGRIRAGES
jgi:hypothetical protein